MKSRGPISNTNTSMRGFATSSKGNAADGGVDDSIFASADYFKEAQDLQKDVQADLTEMATSKTETLTELPFMDLNDTLGASLSVLPKDLGNLVQGVQTYGLSESFLYYDAVVYDLWLGCADFYGLGLGYGLIATALIARGMFAPVIAYSQTVGAKMKLIQPDQDEIMASMKRYQAQGNRESVKQERAKLKRMRKTHGIYPILSMLNLGQLPLHLVFISLINKLSFDYTINPGILTEGIWWFTDLSSPDPICVLPMIGGFVNMMNMQLSTSTNTSVVMRKMRRYIWIMPVFMVPVWMTFPVAFNLYWVASSSIQMTILILFRFQGFKEFMGVPEYLPGTKLERIHAGPKTASMGGSWANQNDAPKVFDKPQKKLGGGSKKKAVKALAGLQK